MKFSNILMMSAACLAMASCSSDEPGVNNNAAAEGGYVEFAISLPTDNGTRAAVDYESGDASEYAVKNGKVIVFRKGATESAAAWVCTADLNGFNWSAANATGEVTTTSKAVAQLQNIDLIGDAAYAAVVVLNYNADFKFPVSGDTFGSWSETAQTSSMRIEDGNTTFLTMSNAAKYAGASAEPTVLVDLDKSKIGQTEAAAVSNGVAAEVYVQRALAKVSLSSKDSYNVTSETFSGDKVTIEAWTLDVKNTKSFPVQVTAGLSSSFSDIWKGGNTLDRFFGTGSAFPRVYWAKDPNYDRNISTLDAVKAEFELATSVSGKPAYLYALENTFDVNHQMQGQTTRVLVKAKYTPAGFADGETFYRLGSGSKLWKLADLEAEIKAQAVKALGSSDVTVSASDAVKEAGNHTLSEFNITKGGAKVDAAAYKSVAENLGMADANTAAVATFKGGESYYVVRVRHFNNGDDSASSLCSWQVGNETYGGNNLRYLGRYGMVRNNWYEVNVNSFSGPGAPTIPEIKPEVPDDENEYFVNASVSILSWSKRVQNIDL